jgi:hypothetical protein
LSCSPFSHPPDDSACYEVTVEGAASRPSVLAAQARRHAGVLRGRPKLGGVGEPASGWWMSWTPVLWIWTSGRPTGHEFVASCGQLPRWGPGAPIVGWRPASALSRATVSFATFDAIDSRPVRWSGLEAGDWSPESAVDPDCASGLVSSFGKQRRGQVDLPLRRHGVDLIGARACVLEVQVAAAGARPGCTAGAHMGSTAGAQRPRRLRLTPCRLRVGPAVGIPWHV